MRLTVLLILIGCLHAGASGVAQAITLSTKNMPLDKVCKEIERQTGYYFVYANNINTNSPRITIEINHLKIEEALPILFKELPFTYQMIEKIIVINTITKNNKENKYNAESNAGHIHGKVTNAQGEPLVNASIVSKKTKKSAETGVNGEFVLKGIDADDELIITYIGYKSQKIKISSHTTFNISLDITDNELDKAVVQAYGTTSQRLATGNITRITAEEIEKQPVMNPLLAMEGKVAGLVVTPLNGYASGIIKVELRGRNAINSSFPSDPLYIIDGVPLTVLDVHGTISNSVDGTNNISTGFDQTGSESAGGMSPAGGQNPLFSLNPGDIESIEVLKDADATAIYGSRGANGVILITTKHGMSGKNRLDINISQGVNTAGRYWNMLNNSQYLSMRHEAFRNDAITPSSVPGIGYAPDLLTWDTSRSFDWQKYEWGRKGQWTNIQSGLSGGNAQTTFRISTAYNHATDITTASGTNQRASLSLNLTNHSTDRRFLMTFATNYSFAQVNIIGLSTFIATLPPDAPSVYDSLGNLNYSKWSSVNNIINFPFAGLLQPYDSKTNFLTSNLALSYSIFKGLTVKTSFGYNNIIASQTSLTTIASQDPAGNPKGSANFGTNRISNWIIEPQSEYNNYIGRGRINVLAGATIQENTTDALGVYGSGYTNDALLRTITNAPSVRSNDRFGQYKYAGAFARFGYNWENRYLLNLNGRRDGSSRFGPNKQYGNFGSVGLAWIISDERWVRGFFPTFVSFIKLRSSYGITGSDAVGDYQYLSQWGNINPNLTPYDDISSLSPQIQPNPNFHWQVNKKLEGAIDIGLFHDFVNFEIAFYRNRCNNQLVSFPIPEFTGFTSVTANSPANVQNTGIEFLINAKIVAEKNVSWNINWNVGINRNKLLSYPDLAQSPYYLIYKVGQSLGNVYLLHFAGISPQNGQYTYTDWNHDGVINRAGSGPPGTGNDDRYWAVNLSSNFGGGMGNQVRYKNIQFTLFFTFRKQMGINALTSNGYNAGNLANTSKYQYEHRWKQAGDISESSRLTTGGTFSDSYFSSSSGSWTDASFIRLQTLSLSYFAPEKFAHKIAMNSLSFFLNGQNIFCLTNYKGVDPETQNFGGIPLARTVAGGVSCSF